MERIFYDENTDKIYTFSEVEKMYLEAKENNWLYEDETFCEWLNAVTDKNGSLTECYRYQIEVFNEICGDVLLCSAIGSCQKNACYNLFCEIADAENNLFGHLPNWEELTSDDFHALSIKKII